MTLRLDQHHEDHQANDLPERLCRLRDRKELNNHAIPEELAHKAEDHERNQKRKEDGEELNIGVALLV